MDNGGITPVMPIGNGYGDGFGGGGSFMWIFGLIVLLALFNGGGFGFGGGFGGWGNGFGFGGMYEFPWLLTGQQGINNNTNAGFRDSMLQDGITSVRDGIAGLSTQLCGCCSDTQMAIANLGANIEQGANARQIANMQSDFALQNAINQGFNGTQASLANCCCENRLGIADLKYTIATENCADRAALSDGIRDIIASNTASTQRILDQLCQDKIDAKNDTIAQLRQELLFARGQASQDVQTAELRANNATVANQLLNEMRSCPIPAQPVYGSTPIFTCNSNTGCGCGCGSM